MPKTNIYCSDQQHGQCWAMMRRCTEGKASEQVGSFTNDGWELAVDPASRFLLWVKTDWWIYLRKSDSIPDLIPRPAYLRFAKHSPQPLLGAVGATGVGMTYVAPVLAGAMIYHVYTAEDRVRSFPTSPSRYEASLSSTSFELVDLPFAHPNVSVPPDS